jgi:hypothetical protein
MRPVGREAPARVGLALTLAGVALSLSACSKFLDAIVFNPCPHVLEVRFPGREGFGNALAVEPESTRRVRDVIADVGRDATVRVELRDGSSEEVVAPDTDDDPVPVLIPARFCD